MKPTNPDNYNASTQYEMIIYNMIHQNLSKVKGIKLANIDHNVKLKGTSGYTHQIDICYRLIIWQTEFLVIVECKNYKRRVSVDDLLEFKSRIDDLKVHKGLFVTSSGFQSGAKKFAEANRIALLIIKGAKQQLVRYKLAIRSPLEKCRNQIKLIEDHFKLSNEDSKERLSIDHASHSVIIKKNGASLRLEPYELHKSMLYLQSCKFDEHSCSNMYFVDTRFNNLKCSMILKSVVIEILLET